MAQNVLDAQGTIFEIDSTPIIGVRGWSGLNSGTSPERDRTDLLSTEKEYALGLPDPGNMTLDMLVVPSDAGFRKLWKARKDRTEHTFTCNINGAQVGSFNARVSAVPLDGNADSDVTSSVTLRLTGAVNGIIPDPV